MALSEKLFYCAVSRNSRLHSRLKIPIALARFLHLKNFPYNPFEPHFLHVLIISMKNWRMRKRLNQLRFIFDDNEWVWSGTRKWQVSPAYCECRPQWWNTHHAAMYSSDDSLLCNIFLTFVDASGSQSGFFFYLLRVWPTTCSHSLVLSNTQCLFLYDESA